MRRGGWVLGFQSTLALLAAGFVALGCGESERSGHDSAPPATAGSASDDGGESGGGDAGGSSASSGGGSSAGSGASSSGDSGDGGGAGAPADDIRTCGDGYVDEAAGEECEPSSNCSGDCRLLPCTDPGPCLVAERDENGDCVVHDADDGAPCEDGNACTVDDRCQGGVCSGDAIKQQPSLRGEVQTFGASPGMTSWTEGSAAFMSDDRLVFLESKSFTSSALGLVQVDSQGLNLLSTATSDAAYFYDIGWVYRPLTHIVPLTKTDFAVVDGHDTSWTTPRNIEIFEIDGDELVSHGVTAMPDDGPLAYGAAGREDTLWVCGPGELETYAFDATSKQLKLAERFALPPGEGCNALALAADGQTLFMATKGVRVVDVSGDPRPSDPANDQVPEICPAGTQPRDPSSTAPETCTVLPSFTLSDVQVNEDYLAALSTDNVGDWGSALAVSMHDSTVIQAMDQETLPIAGPIGIALSGDRLFVEWSGRYSSDADWSSVHLALHPLGADSTLPLAHLPIRDDCCGGGAWTLLSFVARGDFAVAQPWRRVAHFDPANQELAFVTGTAHGSLKALVPSSDTEVVAVGPIESHWIDLSDPDAPQIISGGMNLSPATGDFQLLTPGLGVAPRLANTPSGILERLEQKSPHERFSILDTSQAPQAAELGSFWIEGESGDLIAASHGQVFQLRDTANWGFQVRRYQASAGIGLDVQQLTPDLDVIVQGDPTPAYTLRGSGAFGVNDSGTELVIVERHYAAGYGSYIPVATWLSVGTNDVSVLAQAEFNAVNSSVTDYDEVNSAQHILVVGDDALVVDYKFAARLHRTGTSIVQQAFHSMDAGPDDLNPIIERILAFDGQRAALSVHHWTQTRQSRYTVEVLDSSDLSTLASYDTSEEVQSMLTVGTQLVFGMNSAVSVATPYCP